MDNSEATLGVNQRSARLGTLMYPPDAGGRPESLMTMIVQGPRGIVFAKGVWYAGATVLDSVGSFSVPRYRDDTPADDELHGLSDPFEIQTRARQALV